MGLNVRLKLLIRLIQIKLNFDGVNYKLLNWIEPNKIMTTSNRNTPLHYGLCIIEINLTFNIYYYL